MTPTDLQIAQALLTLLRQVGSTPAIAFLIVLLVIVVGPWIFSLFTSRQSEKRFDAMKQMYESNVKLVECYEALTQQQADTLLLNTSKWSEALDKIDTNQFCPLNRTRKQRMEDIR